MPFNQTTFLGASLLSINATHGRGGQQSQCTVSLVEDPRNSDSFSPTPVGSPATITFGSFSFRGIIQNYTATADINGNPVYTCLLTDPSEIVNAVTIVTNGYANNITQVPNCYNVYGHLESVAFGNSLINDSGLKWRDVAASLTALINSTPISFRGYTYLLDISLLPQTVPDDYRVGGSGFLTITDFIQDLCDAASYDFYFRLTAGNVITLQVIDRSFQPNFGLIQSYVSTTSGASSKSIGRDLRNETTSKFLVGGQVDRIWFVEANEEDEIEDRDDELEARIWPFWGFDINGNLIIGTGLNDDHHFKLDARFLDMPEIGDEYEVDVGELRAALDSPEAWQTYMWVHDNNPNKPWKNNLATRLKIISNGTQELRALFSGAELEELKTKRPFEIIAGRRGDILKDNSKTREEQLQRLYEAIRQFAQEYYGRKFMCRLPNISVKRVPETNNYIYSDEPIESGFLAEEVWADAIQNAILPFNVNTVLDTDGKITAYVRYDEVETLDGSQLSLDDYTINSDRVFIKCSVEDKIVFRNLEELEDPRAIIVLPAPISIKNDGENVGSILKELLTDALNLKGIEDEDAQLAIINNLFDRFGGEAFLASQSPEAIIPNIAAVPLHSNILTYGPWYAVGADGKTEFEKDDTLTPWNYGGWDEMNAAGAAKVTTALSNNQEEESGTVVVPAAPNRNLGDQIVAGGPYITDINISIDQGGVLTTYNMRTWSPRADKASQFLVDRVKVYGKGMQEYRRNFRELDRIFRLVKAGREAKRKEKLIERSGRLKDHSSSQVIAGDVIKGEGLPVKHNVVFSPLYDIVGRLNASGWPNKVLMSMDGLIRPIGWNAGENFSNIEEPDAGATVPTSTELNPFQDGHDIGLLTQGEEVPDSGLFPQGDYQNIVRAFALRGPLMITGPCYDINGKPVPNEDPENPTDNFAEGYLSSPETWKTGPLDARWDDSRKVYVAGGDFKIGSVSGCLAELGEGYVFRSYERMVVGRGLKWGPSEFSTESGITRLESYIRYYDNNGVADTGNLANGIYPANIYIGNGLSASPLEEGDNCNMVISLQPPPSGSGCSIATTISVITDIYCVSGDLHVCTRDLTFDSSGRLTCVQNEVCPSG